MEHFYIFLVNFWDLYNYFTWVASSLANIMKKMVLTTGLPVHCFSSVSDWAFDESWRKGKKRGEGGREEILFLSCPFPPPSSHFFALFPTHNKQTRERLLCRILVHHTAAFSLFWKTSNTAPATHVETLIGAFYSSFPLQRVFCFL